MNNNIETYTAEELLYSNNLGKKSFQWELWHCCNNLCKFCYLGSEKRHTDKERQLKSLFDLKESLRNFDTDTYNNVSLIGGEFFQGQIDDVDVNKAFFEIIEMLCDMYKSKKIGSIWITATLTIGKQADLYKMLDMFADAGVMPKENYGASGVWICTSWDAQGRFHTENHKKNWEHHMKKLANEYPWVKKNTCIILMQKLCEMYLSGEFSPKAFMKKFDTLLFYKQTGVFEWEGKNSTLNELKEKENFTTDELLTILKKDVEEKIGFRFYPDRRTFRKFLLKYAREDADTFERLFNIQFRADEVYRNYNDDYESVQTLRDKNSNFESDGVDLNRVNVNCLIEPVESKHIFEYATYSDCNECMICDRDQIWKSVHGDLDLL